MMAKAADLMMQWSKALKKAPKPCNDSELAILSEWYFGKRLHLGRFSASYASYEIEEDYNTYHGQGFQFSEQCIYGYDHSARFWEHVFGRLSCGGIARASYGQFNIIGYRQKQRLMAWEKSRRASESGHTVRPAFVRLARCVGAGENRIIRGSSVLIAGRADGAAGASLPTGAKS